MPRPFQELQKLEDEQRRRRMAYRRLRWERRLRIGLWILGGGVLLATAAILSHLAGLSTGWARIPFLR